MKLDDPTGRLAWSCNNTILRSATGAAHSITWPTHYRGTLPIETCAADVTNDCLWYRLYDAISSCSDEEPDYCIRGGRLYRYILHLLNKDDTGDEWKICVRTTERPAILRENHDALTAGHLEIAKTISRVARAYYWPGMFRDAAKHIKTCESCLTYKPSQRGTAGHMWPHPAERPWEIVALDLVGPLPR